MDYKRLTRCRVCGSKDLKKYLDLGKQPLANSLLSFKDSPVKRYPLEVLFCKDCALSQLSIVVDPEILYSNYPYNSSISETFKEHCRGMAFSLKTIYQFNTDIKGQKPLVLDIASNDGCLLEEFRKADFYVMGIEPATNLANKADIKNISTINGFWNDETATRVPPCDIITATNVFAHVDDVKKFIQLASKILCARTKGFMVIEVPYLYNLILKNQFDTIYHEHLSYFLLRPLKILFEACGSKIFKVEQYPIHGGSLRIYASPYKYIEHGSVKKLEAFEKEKKLYEFSTYIKYKKKVTELKDSFSNLLEDLKKRKKMVMAYGASAKACMLMNSCNIDSTYIHSVVDDTIDKQNKFIPGCGIPIVSRDHFDTNHPDYIALMSWNFSDELMAKTASHKKRGVKYIVPIPEVRII